MFRISFIIIFFISLIIFFFLPNHFAASFRFRNSFPVGLHVHDMDFISCHAISRTLTNYPGKGNLKTPLQVPVVYSSRPMKKP